MLSEILPSKTLMGLDILSPTWSCFVQRQWFGLSQRFESQIGGLAKLMDEVHLLQETSLSSLGQEAILSNVQKPIQSIKANEETEICSKQNKRNLQKP